jgi:hypothetical protein
MGRNYRFGVLVLGRAIVWMFIGLSLIIAFAALVDNVFGIGWEYEWLQIPLGLALHVSR